MATNSSADLLLKYKEQLIISHVKKSMPNRLNGAQGRKSTMIWIEIDTFTHLVTYFLEFMTKLVNILYVKRLMVGNFLCETTNYGREVCEKPRNLIHKLNIGFLLSRVPLTSQCVGSRWSVVRVRTEEIIAPTHDTASRQLGCSYLSSGGRIKLRN